MRSPTGDEVVPRVEWPVPASQMPPRVDERALSLNAVLTVARIPFQESGPHRVEVQVDGDTVHADVLYVDPSGEQ